MPDSNQNEDSVPSHDEEDIEPTSTSITNVENVQKRDKDIFEKQIEVLKIEFMNYQRKAEADKITLGSRIQMLQGELSETKKLYQSAEAALESYKNIISTLEEEIEILKSNTQKAETEKVDYLSQIRKLQDIIQQTESDIEDIEAGHIEIQNQLRSEIQRLEERTGQMSEDLSRETTGSLARNQHIRTILEETELGKITLYIVDYFENTKKRTLALSTLASEVGMTPIIVRSHIRNLHGLGICEFNEVTREIRLTK
ncbi:MAG: hypothetical protein EAX86_04590 [Candidatus Heimdallarchaeota archaeon]|nr:hypothetical protein [Candidatus Heimdallarchaeota archaeon]